ncbi:hypothetical protein ABE288_24505 [Bacillus salipaludis]|uniref:hypothetical protein n=1 Tax=Bacillus salipaludis TaxID=2547811 RepID=UPI003D1EEEC6
MKRKLSVFVAVLVVFGSIGYGVYRVGLNMASAKLIENVSKDLETSGELAKIKQSIQNDPSVRKTVESDPKLKNLVKKADSGSSASTRTAGQPTTKAQTASNKGDTSTTEASIQKLPFNTKEDAAKLLISKIGLPKLKDMYSKVQAGTMTKAEVLQILRSKLTEDEITALKLVAYNEITKS